MMIKRRQDSNQSGQPDEHDDQRISRKDKRQLLQWVGGILVAISMPVVGVCIAMLVRMSVVESKVEDLRQDVRELRRGIPTSTFRPNAFRPASENAADGHSRRDAGQDS